MFKIYACKATIRPNCLISTHLTIEEARTSGHETHNIIKQLMADGRLRPFHCVILTSEDDVKLEQYGSY